MESQPKGIVILGSTGSIGRQTLDVIRALPGRFRVIGLAAGQNDALLREQVAEFRPRCVSLAIPGYRGEEGLTVTPPGDMACLPDADIVVIALSGTAGLTAVMAAAKAGKTVALANKESLVAAGGLVFEEATRAGASILPVDSEHSAIWQCLRGEEKPRRIILTASGGPFRNYTAEQMADITIEQALAHPSWKMGRKVTIDSATLLNKGLEIIEARWLFDVPIDDITVLVHPQSIIHSMVEFADGSTKAQLSWPDMRLPIQYALTYPERLPNATLPVLDWYKLSSLTFEPPDLERFPCLRLAIEAGKKAGTYPAALCAAGEAAVDLFLAEQIRFTDIARLIGTVLDRHENNAQPSLEEIIHAQDRARELVADLVREES